MDDEDVYGALIDHMSFKEAIETKPPILSDYKIVTTIVKKSEIEELIKNNDFVKSDGKDWSIEADASMFASLIALRKLLSEQDIRHIVSFHSSIKRAKEFMVLNTKASKIDSSLSALTAFHVSGKDGTAVRAQTLERFVDAQPSLITNARCLTEGVDIPAIDAVLFADPKQSVIDIVQATGRALRRFDKKDFGYIILPIVIDEHNDASVKEGFAQIINVLSALAINDDRIIDEFKAIVAGQRKQGPIVEINTPYPATIVVPSIDFEQFRSNIEILVWDRLSFAKSVIGESDFTKWMRDTTNLTEASIKHYTNAMRKISNDLVRLKLAYSSLEELMYSEDPKTLKKEYFAIPKYKELNDRGNNMYSVAFDHLINYHQDKYSITQ